MARPKKDDPRKARTVWLNDEEYQIIQEKAEYVNMSISAWLRQIAVNKRQPSPPKKIPATTHETNVELGKIRSILNRTLMNLKDKDTDADLNRLRLMISRLEIMKGEIIDQIDPPQG